jgi:hypothetical protein
MNGDEVTRSALSSSSFDDGISFSRNRQRQHDSGIPCGRPVRCRAHAGPGPCCFDASPQDWNGAWFLDSTPRCFRKDEHGETLLSRMRCLFKEVGVISSPSTHRSAQLWTGPRQYQSSSLATHGALYSCKRPYGGYATSYVLVVLIYTQIATSAWSRSNMKRKKEGKKESSANAILSSHHSNMNVHQNLNPYFPLLLPPTMENR